MILVADSGSTKTAWILQDGAESQEVQTAGINPVRDSKETIMQVIASELLPALPANIHTFPIVIHFYGAGCIAPYINNVEEVLQHNFPQASIQVESDLLGAARALCGNSEGIACILGTGSNSCLYDGQRITQNVSPLGYILGDEGSGAVLGKTLVGNILKNQLGEALRETFLQEYQLSPQLIIDRVYRQPMANKFLASLVPFIAANIDIPAMKQMVIQAFCDFLQRNVANYNRPDLPVHFVGGIASQFMTELAEAHKQCGLKMGEVLRSPIEKMVDFHKKSL